ncbi:hypothetical protein F4818DRAFT_440706 [Hypoxylon cercidicola]|nr:hypothetical protein F4818DRAFT_440706 [Hypoxylon cercidicola]
MTMGEFAVFRETAVIRRIGERHEVSLQRQLATVVAAAAAKSATSASMIEMDQISKDVKQDVEEIKNLLRNKLPSPTDDASTTAEDVDARLRYGFWRLGIDTNDTGKPPTMTVDGLATGLAMMDAT